MRIESLPLWEKELIHCHKLFDNDETLSRLLSMDIVIATDGSYKDDKGSYGWIITTPNGIYLAKGSGTVFGNTLSSFRCEGYGILAALRFILHLRLHFHQPVPNATITWWCDSLSLLQRLAPQPIPNPNRSKLADHDVESSIRHSVPLVTTKLQSIHIRSHQYDNEPLESIPLPHKLNRIADQLATQHLSQISQPTSKAPLLDPARCQLHIGGNTITRALPTYLRSAFSDKHIRTHLLRRLDIAPNLDILWPSFSSAFHKLSSSQQRIIRKWVFGFLPTQRRLHRYSDCSSPLCPKCRLSPETDHHFLTCGGATSWSEHLFQPLERLHRRQQITPWVFQTITSNLKNYINQTPPSCPNQWIAPAYDSQTTIGWSSCFYGLFSPTWARQHNLSKPTRPNGASVLTQIVTIIFQALVHRWHERNAQLHNNTEQDETRSRLANKIRALYDCYDKVLASDRVILSTPIHDILTRSNQQLQLFILHNTPIIKHSIRCQKELITRQHRDIASYFHPIPADYAGNP